MTAVESLNKIHIFAVLKHISIIKKKFNGWSDYRRINIIDNHYIFSSLPRLPGGTFQKPFHRRIQLAYSR